MIDLTDNKIPFGLLTPEEQEHLQNWPHGVEWYLYYGSWEDNPPPAWIKSITYRTKPAPVTKVNWANDYGDDDFGIWHPSRERADDVTPTGFPRIAVIRREWTEGQPPKYFTEEV